MCGPVKYPHSLPQGISFEILRGVGSQKLKILKACMKRIGISIGVEQGPIQENVFCGYILEHHNGNTVNFPYCGHPQDCEFVIAENYFSQIFSGDSAAVRIIRVSIIERCADGES